MKGQHGDVAKDQINVPETRFAGLDREFVDRREAVGATLSGHTSSGSSMIDRLSAAAKI